MPAVTLIDGRQVDSASEEWRVECEARELLRRNTNARREYLEIAERKRGPEATQRLKDVFMKLWEAKKR